MDYAMIHEFNTLEECEEAFCQWCFDEEQMTNIDQRVYELRGFDDEE